MLRDADDDLIARLQARAGIALRHHIDGLRGAPGPDDGFVIWRIQQTRHFLPCGLIARGQALGLGELAAMDIASAQTIELPGRLDNGLRFKGRRGAIQIDARVSECRKLRAKLRGIESVHGIPRFSNPIVAQIGR